MKKNLSLYLLAAVVAFAACNSDDDNQATTGVVTGVTLSQVSVTLTVGDTLVLTASVQPANAGNQAVTWTSNAENIATVNAGGLVTAIAEGTAIITVTTEDGNKTATCTITAVKAPDVYVVGTSSGKAILWVNGVAQELALTNGTVWASANSVFVSGSDVYVAGSEMRYYSPDDSARVAVLWVNGVLQDLFGGTSYTLAFANSVFVSGSDVYVAGYSNDNGQDANRTVLWTNGTVQELGNVPSLFLDPTNSVFVSGSDVYVAGHNNNQIATLWKNGTAQTLSSGTPFAYATAHSVYVSGNDVYVAGGNGVAILWKNGTAQHLTNIGGAYAIANSVFVSGSDVYVVGREFGTDSWIARLWKNGVAQSLGNGGANAVFVLGSDVYVAGYNLSVAKLWKNGVEQNLAAGTTNAEATSVFVK